MVPNVVVDSIATPLLAVDEVEQVQQQRIAGLIGHMFQLTCANMVDELIEEEKLLRLCYSAPESKTTFFYYITQHSIIILPRRCSGKIDLNAVLSNVENVCNAVGFKLGQSWEMYVSELSKITWTSIFLTSLELDGFDGD